MKYFEAYLRLCMTLFGVGEIEQLVFTPLLSCLRSPFNLNFLSFSSFATEPAGLIHWAYWLVGILLIIPALMSFLTSFLTFSARCSGVRQGFLAKKDITPGWSSTSIGGQYIFCAYYSSYTKITLRCLKTPHIDPWIPWATLGKAIQVIWDQAFVSWVWPFWEF